MKLLNRIVSWFIVKCPICNGRMYEVPGWPDKEQCSNCGFTRRIDD
jgi:ribosomal protein L37E